MQVKAYLVDVHNIFQHDRITLVNETVKTMSL